MKKRTTKRERTDMVPTLIEFNERLHDFQTNDDILNPHGDGWVPITMLRRCEADGWVERLKARIVEGRILDPSDDPITLLEVLCSTRGMWIEEGIETERTTRNNTVYLVCRQCDEGGADVEAALDDELRAYHYMDCEGGDFVEEVRVLREYENHNRRTYRLQMMEGDVYGDVKCNISVVRDLTGVVREKNVRQALRWSRDAKGRLRLTAYIEGTHRYQAFKTAEKIIARHIADVETLDEWTEYPSGRTLHPREPSQLEQDLLANLFSGTASEEDKPLMGLFEGFMRDYEHFKRQRSEAMRDVREVPPAEPPFGEQE